MFQSTPENCSQFISSARHARWQRPETFRRGSNIRNNEDKNTGELWQQWTLRKSNKAFKLAINSKLRICVAF